VEKKDSTASCSQDHIIYSGLDRGDINFIVHASRQVGTFGFCIEPTFDVTVNISKSDSVGVLILFSAHDNGFPMSPYLQDPSPAENVETWRRASMSQVGESIEQSK